MARDDLFRRSFEAGTAFLDMTRERAEALVKELVKAGELQKGKAQKAIDEVLERSRKGAEELRDLIRREVNDQMTTLGLATKDDIARLEAKLEASAARSATAGPDPVTQPTKTPPVTKAGPAKAGPSKRTSAKKAAPAAAAKAAEAAATATKAKPVKAAAEKEPQATKAATTAPSPRKAVPNPLEDEVRTEVPAPDAGGGGAVPRGGPPSGG